jgi:lipid A 4'-phosphatase
MSYLKLRRSPIILGAFVLFSVFATAFPSIDLAASRIFYNGVAFTRDAWWTRLQQDWLLYFLSFAMIAVVFLYGWNRLSGQRVLKIDGRKVFYLLLVLIIGAGLIVNVALKNNFGRARPRDVAEFGGQLQFTPAFAISNQCRTNCSFSSGDAAGGFFALALVMALRRRRACFAAAGAFGVLISVSRVASGAHFLSDTVVSFFVMLIVADVLHHYMIALPEARSPQTALDPPLLEAYLPIRAEAAAKDPQLRLP